MSFVHLPASPLCHPPLADPPLAVAPRPDGETSDIIDLMFLPLGPPLDRSESVGVRASF